MPEEIYDRNFRNQMFILNFSNPFIYKKIDFGVQTLLLLAGTPWVEHSVAAPTNTPVVTLLHLAMLYGFICRFERVTVRHCFRSLLQLLFKRPRVKKKGGWDERLVRRELIVACLRRFRQGSSVIV